VFDAIQPIRGPVYVRQLRGDIPRLFDPAEPLQVGKARILSRGSDIALFSSGICTEEALKVTSILREAGVSVYHVHVNTLKPFNAHEVIEITSKVKYGVITFENHTIIGGLGSAVAEAIAEAGLGKRLIRIGLRDTFAHGGSKTYLMKYYGLDALALVRGVEQLLDIHIEIDEHDLQATVQQPIRSASKAEDL
jgi:transketolase